MCRGSSSLLLFTCIMFILEIAAIAQLVERDLAKVEVAGSNPVCRSFFFLKHTQPFDEFIFKIL